MSRALKLFFLCILACLLQTEFVRYIRIFTVAPDMMIIILVLLTDDFGTFGGFVAGALMALFYDATTGYAPAINLVTYTFIGFMAPFLRENLDRLMRKLRHKRFLEYFMIVFFLTLVREIVYIGYLFLVGAEQGFVTIFRLMVCVVYSSILVLPIAALVDLRRMRVRRRREEKQKESEFRRINAQ